MSIETTADLKYCHAARAKFLDLEARLMRFAPRAQAGALAEAWAEGAPTPKSLVYERQPGELIPYPYGGFWTPLEGQPCDPESIAEMEQMWVASEKPNWLDEPVTTTPPVEPTPKVIPFPTVEAQPSAAPTPEPEPEPAATTANAATVTPPTTTPSKRRSASSFSHTDLGNTEYFEELFGDAVRYDQTRKRWLVWKDHRWEPDGLKRAEESAQSAAKIRLDEAAKAVQQAAVDAANQSGQVTTKKQANSAKDFFDWAFQSAMRPRIDNVLSLAQKRTHFSVQTAKGWDADPWLIGVPNGVVDLRTGTRRAGRPDDRITKHAGVKFDPQAQCPRFERFLREVLCEDDELVTFMRRALGYTLTGDVREDCWFGCFGHGSNGKSTLIKILSRVLGDYHFVAPFSLVERDKSGSRRDFDVAYLQNMRIVIASETREGAVWDEERLKRLSGGDELHAEIKHGAEFWFTATHKLWFMFNHQPRVRDHSKGFWRRVRLIPFNRQFEGTSNDKTLDAKLEAESAGILAWLVRAALEWQQEGLESPDAVKAASAQYEEDEDPLNGFIHQHLQRSGPGFYLKHAYKLYTEWAKDEGSKPLGKQRFASQLELHGFKRGIKNNVPFFDCGRLVYMCTCLATPCRCLASGLATPIAPGAP